MQVHALFLSLFIHEVLISLREKILAVNVVCTLFLIEYSVNDSPEPTCGFKCVKLNQIIFFIFFEYIVFIVGVYQMVEI